MVTVLHSGNYTDCGFADPPENVVINSMPELGKAASYPALLKAGAASADSILVTPCPDGTDKESDAQARTPVLYLVTGEPFKQSAELTGEPIKMKA